MQIRGVVTDHSRYWHYQYYLIRLHYCHQCCYRYHQLISLIERETTDDDGTSQFRLKITAYIAVVLRMLQVPVLGFGATTLRSLSKQMDEHIHVYVYVYGILEQAKFGSTTFK
jgi:hypothetical protein